MPVQSWGGRTPTYKRYAAAAAVELCRINGSKYDAMIVYGGVGYLETEATWLYDLEMKKWQSFEQPRGPSLKLFHTLVTLCSRLVVLFGGADSETRKRVDSVVSECKNETWIFDIHRKVWNVLPIVSTGDFNRPRCLHAAASIVSSTSSSCSCKESMLVYGGLSGFSPKTYLYDMWELRCISDRTTPNLPTYKWIRVNFTGSELRLRFPQASSAFHNSLFILFGLVQAKDMGELWSFNASSSQWYLLSSLGPKPPDKVLYMTGQTTKTHSPFHLVLACCMPLRVFDLVTNQWYTPKPLLDMLVPDLQVETSAMAAFRNSVLTFAGQVNFRIPQTTNELWRLTMPAPDRFHWASLHPEIPDLKTRGLAVGGIVGTKTLVYFGGAVATLDKNPFSTNETWILDLESFIWEKKVVARAPPDRFAAAGTVLQGSLLVVHGGVSFDLLGGSVRMLSDTWAYDSSTGTWSECQTKKSPGRRFLHNALAVDNSTMVILGGFKDIFFYPQTDIWRFRLDTMTSTFRGTWTLLKESGPYSHIGYGAVILGRKIMIYGGTRSVTPGSIFLKVLSKRYFQSDYLVWEPVCEEVLWSFDLEQNIWEKVKYANDTGPGRRCFTSAIRLGDNMIVHGGCSSVNLTGEFFTEMVWYKCTVDASQQGVWSYHMRTNAWTRLSSSASLPNHLAPMQVEWKGLILALGGVTTPYYKPDQWNGFMAYQPVCPPGTDTQDFASMGCRPCRVGRYSSSPGSECTRCPVGLSTPTTGSISKNNCSVCESSLCGHGQCRVALPGPSFYCECNFGYTKNNEGRCAVATYYLAGTGLLAGILLLLLVVAVLVRLKRAQKTNRAAMREKELELTEMTNVWTVDPKELRLGCRLDRRSPGGFGDVWKADYREITVAVKILKQEEFELDSSEVAFEREIQVMRTIRHPNVVMFLGVGHFSDTGRPFIVMEYMSRGCLGNILRNDSYALSSSQQIRFALDAAKGMRFLHSRRPPRIHRDLKSGNLLVSERWVIKVADFGSARLVKDEGVEQAAFKGSSRLTLSIPLLQPQYALSTCVGTALWTAPELLRGDSYGTAVDVYR